jgi:transposase-like protein
MSGKRYYGKFKIEGVKRVVGRSHSVPSLATRLDITTHSLYARITKYVSNYSNKEKSAAQADTCRPQKELKRVNDERHMLHTSQS